MKHIVFLIHVLSFIFGCVTIALSLFSYFKYKSGLVKYYTLFLISLLAILLERTFSYYQMASVLTVDSLNVMFWGIACLGWGLCMYSLPRFTYDLLKLHMSEGKKLMFGMLACLPVVSLVLYYTLPYKIIILLIINLIILITMLYCLCLAIVLLKSVKVPETVKIIKTFLIIFGLWIPIVFIDFRLLQVPSLMEAFPYGLMSIPVFYLVWNFFTLYYGYKYLEVFVHPPGEGKQSHPDEAAMEEERSENAFFERYKFTNREREVIMMLIKGYSYNKVSEELGISFATARTHGYNIYQKAGVSNKVELVNLMKQHK